MDRSRFTKEQQAKIGSLEVVKKVTPKMICFTIVFKKKALKARRLGCHANDIFKDVGIDINLFPKSHFVKLLKDWDLRFNKSGEEFLKEKTKGRPKNKKEKQLEDLNYKELLAKTKYLKLENDFLKKLKALENISLKEKNMS